MLPHHPTQSNEPPCGARPRQPWTELPVLSQLLEVSRIGSAPRPSNTSRASPRSTRCTDGGPRAHGSALRGYKRSQRDAPARNELFYLFAPREEGYGQETGSSRGCRAASLRGAVRPSHRGSGPSRRGGRPRPHAPGRSAALPAPGLPPHLGRLPLLRNRSPSRALSSTVLATMFSSSMGPGGAATSRAAPRRSPLLRSSPAAAAAAAPPLPPPQLRPAPRGPTHQCLPTLLPRRAPIGSDPPKEASPTPLRPCPRRAEV